MVCCRSLVTGCLAGGIMPAWDDDGAVGTGFTATGEETLVVGDWTPGLAMPVKFLGTENTKFKPFEMLEWSQECACIYCNRDECLPKPAFTT